ncbi:YggU family protein [Methanocalculus taiwanensis]|uniref:UPF0235 protein FTO68_08115 n=1 Tax=Methanocalculus taiwanensis TaxID=106207 RepID=A0ABD4TL79_9EURY|nr:DUF167 domain-containing protein [Methanocalculus taiwanensis]MCQ1538944.1 YggU family protein [Methanocalculus taiwanensis]
MASYKDALRISGDGLLISLEVHAGSGRNVFPAGYNCWRKAIGIAITAPPVEGRANAAIIDLISQVMGVPKSAVSILSGHQSTRKVIQIAGMNNLRALEILEPLF